MMQFSCSQEDLNRGLAVVGRAVATWRREAAGLGLGKGEIERMASAFEHEDLETATGL